MNAAIDRVLWQARLAGKRAFFPGLDLNTRCRYRFLSRYLREGDLLTLDAGFGNGALSYAAYRKGNTVIGVSISEREVRDTAGLFDRMGISRDRIQLRAMNIYDIESLGQSFDQIICSETLEHIKRDEAVIQLFARLLKPDGRLLLCCPYALHPAHALGRTDNPETGGHVRDGYTLESYRALLEPAGLRIIETLGLGSPLLCWLDRWLRRVRGQVGDAGALPLFLVMLPWVALDSSNPRVPLSLAVVAEKGAD